MDEKTIAYLKGEKLSQVIASIITKFLFSVAFWWLFMGGKSPTLGLGGKIMGFLLSYLVCSLFVVALVITRNYLLAAVGAVILLLLVAWATDKVNALLGSSAFILDMLIYIVFLFPIGYDVFRVYKLIKS